jgi:hypothetical protein
MWHRDEHARANLPDSCLTGRVFRCAWCHHSVPVSGGLPDYTYVYVADTGCWLAVPASPMSTETDGICPPHQARVRAGTEPLVSAA